MLASVSFMLGCVDVPDNVRAQFVAPGPHDKTNYRAGHAGPHGADGGAR